jgi:uncharacterized membrane protein
MIDLPQAFGLLLQFAPAASPSVFARLLLLAIGAILTPGRRTISRILWHIRPLVQGHPCSYHRCLSKARVSLLVLGRILAKLILEQLPPDAKAELAVDDTTAEHRGAKVYAKACHRDAVRSSHGYVQRKWGHRWVILSILVPLPGGSRPWALPVLCALYRSPKLNAKEQRRHKVPAALARSLVAFLIHQFPDRHFVLLGDGHFSSHDLADFAARHRRHLTLIGRLRQDARLFEKPKHARRVRCATPRKLRQLPAPVVACQGRPRRWVHVPWYGASVRRVGLISACGLWYRAGAQAYVRWVCVLDPKSRRTDYLYGTDPTLAPEQIVRLYARRWNLEVTFQEIREHLGFESTRQWTQRSVLRAAPLLLGLYSVITLLWKSQYAASTTPRGTLCYHKPEPSFADAIFQVRKALWEQVLWEQLFPAPSPQHPAPPPDPLLTDYLADAA